MNAARTTDETAPAPAEVVFPDRLRKDTLLRRAWRQLRRDRLAMVCLGIICVYIVIWLVSEFVYWPPIVADWAEQKWGKHLPQSTRGWLTRVANTQPGYKKSDDSIRNMKSTLFARIPPDWKDSALSFRLSHPLGTDFAGRDNLLRLMQGGRIAFELAILVALISFSLGFTMGAIAGYFGGWIDYVIVYVYSVFASVPGILLIISITYVTKNVLPADTFYLLPIALGMGLTGWVGLCRLIRGEFIKLRERTYVLAATALGASHARIIFKHIAPNTLYLLVINFTLSFPGIIMAETVLSYLGIGIQTEPSWGAMINDAKQRLWVGNWWEIGGIAVMMFLFTLALNIFGDALRDALDPKLHSADTRGT